MSEARLHPETPPALLRGGGTPGDEPLVAVVCAANRPDVLRRMLVASLRQQTAAWELRVVDAEAEKLTGCAAALNAGAADTTAPWLLFVHQDVAFDDPQLLRRAVDLMTPLADLGVAGPVGTARRRANGSPHRVMGRWQSGEERRLIDLAPIVHPQPAQTLDEMMLLVPRGVFDRLQFDPTACPGWHLYGSDYSLSVLRLGLRAYALPLLVHHLSSGRLDAGYFTTLRRLVRKHRDQASAICTPFGCWPTRLPPATLRPLDGVRRAIDVLVTPLRPAAGWLRARRRPPAV